DPKSNDLPRVHGEFLDPQLPRAFAATGTWSELAFSASRHMHGSASRNSQKAPLRMGTADFCRDPASSKCFLKARTARRMCNLALSDAGSPGGRFRPKLLKEMRREAWLAKCADCGGTGFAGWARRCASRRFDSAMPLI